MRYLKSAESISNRIRLTNITDFLVSRFRIENEHVYYVYRNKREQEDIVNIWVDV